MMSALDSSLMVNSGLTGMPLPPGTPSLGVLARCREWRKSRIHFNDRGSSCLGRYGRRSCTAVTCLSENRVYSYPWDHALRLDPHVCMAGYAPRSRSAEPPTCHVAGYLAGNQYCVACD